MDIGFRCFNRKSLETVLPHRGAALRKIDGAFYSSHSPDLLTGIKEIHDHDEDLDGHFPGDPIYPGYAQDEFACLVAAALISLSIKGLKNDPYVIQKNVRYKKNAVPGDTLTANVTLHAKKTKFCMFSAVIKNQKDETIAEYEKIVGAV
jgi:3-hydroxymyristoyl/3-hydroxydecanoyl-(acyl carrier protein) dehydratase